MVDFSRPVSTHIQKVNDVPRDKALRLYPGFTGVGQRTDWYWNLQVRSPMGIGSSGFTEGKDFVVATATCHLDDLFALRAQIDAEIWELVDDGKIAPVASVPASNDTVKLAKAGRELLAGSLDAHPLRGRSEVMLRVWERAWRDLRAAVERAKRSLYWPPSSASGIRTIGPAR